MKHGQMSRPSTTWWQVGQFTSWVLSNQDLQEESDPESMVRMHPQAANGAARDPVCRDNDDWDARV